MQAQEKLSVKVHIAGRLFPLMVIPQEEAAVRQAAKEINDKLAELKNAFSGLDEAHLFSMLALDLATRFELLKTGISSQEAALNHQVNQLDETLNQLLATAQSGSPAS